MKRTLALFLLTVVIGLFTRPGFSQESAATTMDESLLVTRKGHVTTLVKQVRSDKPLQRPPVDSGVTLVQYPGPLGQLTGYLVEPREPKPTQPAIIWINGGFPPGGGSEVWEEWAPANPFRDAGLVVLYPTVRGDCGNAGVQESFYGEVDDILAAADYVSSLDSVDPKQIYLAGHSTGGTLALLVSAATDRFRAVFALGPVSDPARYGANAITYDPDDAVERKLRAPIECLSAIRKPTFIIEGYEGNNSERVRLEMATKNALVFSFGIFWADHFEAIHSTLDLIAEKISPETPDDQRRLSAKELNDAYSQDFRELRLAQHRRKIAELSERGIDVEQTHRVVHRVHCRRRLGLETLRRRLQNSDCQPGEILEPDANASPPRFHFQMSYEINGPIVDAETIDESAASFTPFGPAGNIMYDGWELAK